MNRASKPRPIGRNSRISDSGTCCVGSPIGMGADPMAARRSWHHCPPRVAGIKDVHHRSAAWKQAAEQIPAYGARAPALIARRVAVILQATWRHGVARSEEHTSELQSRGHLVCRLLRANKQSQ